MKSTVINLISSITLCAVLVAVYGYWYAEISNKSVAVTDLQNRIEARTREIDTAAKVRSTFSEIADEETVLQDYFVSETGVVAFISELESRGRPQNTVVDVLSVAQDKKSAKPTLTFSLTITGKFDSVLRTIGSIEYAPHIISISTLSFAKELDKNTWRADITIGVRSSASVASSTAAKKL